MSMSVRKNKLLEHINAYQSHGCLIFYAVKSTFESYLKIFSNMPGVIYKSENQNLASFKDNFEYLHDLLFVAYFDFETTTGSGSKNSLDDEEMQILNVQLLSEVFNEMIDELDLVTGIQLKECTIPFHQKKKETGLQFPKFFLVS